jgi:hypothetical protein
MSTVSGLDIANNIEREWRDRLDAAVLAEREACARLAESTICDTHLPTGVRIYGTRVADAIRARNNT